MKEASKDLSNEVKAWAGSAWGSFNRLIKSKIGVSVPGAPDDSATTISAQSVPAQPVDAAKDAKKSALFGKLNGGAPIDYVLQEDPFEAITETQNALKAHDNYWFVKVKRWMRG